MPISTSLTFLLFFIISNIVTIIVISWELCLTEMLTCGCKSTTVVWD